jgi:molybdopterin-guanine dinucleotide biosynthesis protein A
MAVLLAGGRGSRLGGRHKPGITVAGHTLLDRSLAAVADAERTVVVGPECPTSRPVCWTVEQPRGGGPVAALAAGLAALPDTTEVDAIAVLAADLIGVTQDTIQRLLTASHHGDGAVLRDATGHRQWLIGVWRPAALRAAVPADTAGRSLRSVLAPLAVTDVPELPGESADVDTPADLARFLAGVREGPIIGDASQPSHW